MYPEIGPHESFRERASNLIGTELDVCEFEAGFSHNEVFVSRVRVENDPWDEVRNWPEGQLKVMEVLARTTDQAFGIIHPGVRARIRLEAKGILPANWNGFDLPLPGDEVAGYFRSERVDQTSRIVELDFLEYARSNVSVSDVLVPSAGQNHAVPVHVNSEGGEAGLTQAHFERSALGNINRILVVDDDVPFLGSLCKFLRDLGFLVVPCQSAGEANTALDRTEEQPDLAILDVHLRAGLWNFDGLRLASSVAARCPSCRILLTTGDELDIRSQSVLGFAELPVSGILSKPFGIQDVFTAFSGALGPPLKLQDLLGLGTRPGSRAGETPVMVSFQEELEAICESLRAMISGEAVVLFSIHPVSDEVKIVGRADPSSLFARVGRKLELSPIRDAAIKMKSVHTGHAGGHRDEPIHRWLLRAYRYESCVGVPVPLNTASPLGYALFAFHRERDRFTPVERYFVDHAARTAGHVLRTMQFDADRRSERVFEIMGKVYGSMAHDLSQALSDGFLFDQLRKEIDSGNLDEAGAIAFKLEVRSRRAQGIVHTFRSMARGQHEEESDFRIDAVLKEAVRVFRPELSDENTRCQMIPYAGPPCMVHMRKSGLEQILLNLLLNAAQQIKRVRDFRNAPGEIKVAIERSKDAQGEWAEILVYDNGPGIHKRDFDHVFDVHFTTKEDGCGMGLAVLSQQSGAIPALRASIMCGQVWLSYMKEV